MAAAIVAELEYLNRHRLIWASRLLLSFLYPLAELKKRRERLQRLMQEARLDSILVTNDENFIHLIGAPGPYGQHKSNDRPGVAVIPVEGEPICVVSGATVPNVRPVMREENILAYTSTLGIPTDLVVKAIKRAGLQNKRVGIESGLSQRLGLPYSDFTEILKNLPNIEFVDASSILWRIRMIKSKTEIRYLKESADITEKARQKCFDEMSVGMTYREIGRLFYKLLMEAGADSPSFTILKSWPQDRTYDEDFVIFRILLPEIPTKKGEALFFDGGAYIYTYTVDYNRWGVFGKASTKMRKYHDIASSVSDRMGEALRPGLTCSDIFDVARKELKNRGAFNEDNFAGRMGHGQGMLWTEPPSIAPKDKTIIEPGLVVSTEPFAVGESMWVAWEDVWVVHEDGAELLTKESHELREVTK